MSKRVRILALVLAVLVLCGTLIGLFRLTAWAAPSNYRDFMITKGGTEVRELGYNSTVTMTFQYIDDFSGITGIAKGVVLTVTDFDTEYPWSTSSSNCKMTLTIGDPYDDSDPATDMRYVKVKLENVQYQRSIEDTSLVISIDEAKTGGANGTVTGYNAAISTNIPDTYFGGSNTTTDDDDNPYTSQIIIENVYVTDSEGVRIDEIDKDSPPFTLVLTYIDRGLREVDDDEFTSNSLEVYLTDPGGFVAAQGQKGTLKYMNTNSNEAPRFQARFQNVTYDGSGASVGITAYYDIMGYELEGKSPVWKVAAVDDEEEDELAPLTPHIIVSQYSYGDEQINAGDSFTLNMSVTNTSPDITLENIVMTIAPYIPENTDSTTTGGLTITSASNTKYIPALGVGESFSHTIDLRAEASAAVGSHRVEVDFSFQYVDEVNTKRESSTDKESIAIPVSQVDRFSVDPLTELPDILYEGEEGYVTLSFINRGKSVTRNISGSLSGNMANTGQIVHYGNLEAGGADTMDFEVMAAGPGEMTGEILLQYEDENENQKEITIPFSIRVEEMYYPEYDNPGMMEEPEAEQGLGIFTIAFCAVGALLIAAPITLYLHKRVKAKGIEELDEDI